MEHYYFLLDEIHIDPSIMKTDST